MDENRMQFILNKLEEFEFTLDLLEADIKSVGKVTLAGSLIEASSINGYALALTAETYLYIKQRVPFLEDINGRITEVEIRSRRLCGALASGLIAC
ncbi:hypothetical protein [Eubacterium limosum]|uniref:hypothetical protein n=1 Tax=Eubacterium limosum TaxID=1736 RepID=UPI001062EBB5|nr:hypothetical protein [Eubacterium limosum]